MGDNDVNNDLYNEINNLIGIGTEGEYWDFKKEWHTKKADLLHDIICMANNIANHDAYIIIGVSDSKSASGIQINDVSNDANRKDQQQLITFLRDKNFAGGVRPTVYLETIEFDNNHVDVVIIKNTNKTPYFLTKDFKDDGILHANHVYTRIGDTNTPKDKTADLDKVEYLWRKRLGIDLTVNQRLLILLDNPTEWVGDFKDRDDVVYHSVYPEFQIKIVDKEEHDTNFSEDNDIVQNLAAHNPDKTQKVRRIEITYHATVLFSDYVIYLDGFRYIMPIPSSGFVYIDKYHDVKRSLAYLYFDLLTIRGRLYKCLLSDWYSSESVGYSKRSYIVFNDELERKRFDDFAEQKLPQLLIDYPKVLSEMGYHEGSHEDAEYFYFGWSKGNEIKSRYLFDLFLEKETNLANYIYDKSKLPTE